METVLYTKTITFTVPMARAQATLEYLVIFAAIAIIILAVVTLTASSTDSAAGALHEQSRIYWRTQKIAILEATADSEGDAILRLRSDVDGNLENIQISGVEFDADGEWLEKGDELMVYFTGFPPCRGPYTQYEVVIEYLSRHGLGQTIQGQVDLVVSCDEDVSAGDIAAEEYISVSPP